MEITFTDPEYLWFLFMIPVLIIVHFASLRSTKRKALKFANFQAIERVTGGQILSKNLFLLYIRLTTIILFVLALSGATYWYSGSGSNFDFVIAIDASNSMLSTDFNPNRIESAKTNALEFLDLISANNKIGVVSFAGTSIIETPLTNKFSDVKSAIKNIYARNIGGTDLGEAIVTSTNLLLQAENPRMIILLTDGQSNVGVGLQDAIKYAKSKFVTIHTIGIGTEKGGDYIGNVSLTLDEETLKKISKETDGTYFRAENDKSLVDIYNKIAAITETRVNKNLSIPFLVISLILVIIEWTMLNTKYRTIP